MVLHGDIILHASFPLPAREMFKLAAHPFDVTAIPVGLITVRAVEHMFILP
jgi:hypothetical protein